MTVMPSYQVTSAVVRSLSLSLSLKKEEEIPHFVRNDTIVTLSESKGSPKDRIFSLQLRTAGKGRSFNFFQDCFALARNGRFHFVIPNFFVFRTFSSDFFVVWIFSFGFFCHLDFFIPFFLSSRAKARDLILRALPEGAQRRRDSSPSAQNDS